jgi:salicylate hydroxylase
LRVVVIGGGIGGIAAAGALHKLGCEVEVYERASELGEVGAGLQIGPNGVKVLQALGLAPTLGGLAAEPVDTYSLAWDDGHVRFGEPMKATAVEKYGAPYITAHRADLHRLLQEKVPAGAIHTNAACVGVASDEKHAVAKFASGREVEADIVIGADGIRSVVREALFGVTPARYTEQMAWRGIIAREDVPKRVGPNKSVAYSPMNYVGWIGPNGHVICYPIRGGELYNMFIGHVSPEWVDESWTAPSTREDILKAHEGWCDDLLGMLGKVGDIYKWGIYDREPLKQWTKGRVTLAGDAAHPMMPTLAQGASITLEDAYAVARNIARYKDDPVAGLKSYEGERIARASGVQLQARRQFDNNRKVPPPPPLSRDWIFEYDASVGPKVSAA